MDHGPAVKLEKDNASGIKAKIGLIMFFIYCVIYSGFVAINILSPKLMEKTILCGLNLAVIYGFGLILIAIVLGFVYNLVCTKLEIKLN